MLRKDKALLENLTRKYGKDFVINEMTKNNKYTPDELYNMTKIPDEYFKNRKDLKEIVIPDNITYIGWRAFAGCSNLTSVTIPDSVTEIGNSAFEYCTSLTSVTIPDSVTSIGWSAFSDCTSLTSVNIPNRVTSIGAKTFYNCESLTSVTIGNSVKWINDYAFYDCNNLTTVTIPNTVTHLGSWAFPTHVKKITKNVVKSDIDVTKKERDTRNNNNPLNLERNRKDEEEKYFDSFNITRLTKSINNSVKKVAKYIFEEEDFKSECDFLFLRSIDFEECSAKDVVDFLSISYRDIKDLMEEDGYSIKEIIKYIKEKKGIITPYFDFIPDIENLWEEALDEYEKEDLYDYIDMASVANKYDYGGGGYEAQMKFYQAVEEEIIKEIIKYTIDARRKK